MISQDLILDEDFNSLTIESQNIFVRMLAVSDDYGIVPASEYTLQKLINTPEKTNLQSTIKEILSKKLCVYIVFQEKPYYVFKRDRFDDFQSYLIAKRTKSEYLRLSKEIMESDVFQEFLGDYKKFSRKFSAYIESSKYKVESTKYKEGGESSLGLEQHLLQMWGGKDGKLTVPILQQMIGLGDKHGFDKLFDAIEIAAKANAKNYRYVEGILNKNGKSKKGELKDTVEDDPEFKAWNKKYGSKA